MIKFIILIIFLNLLPVSAKNLEPIDIVKKTVSEVLETIQNDKEIIAGNKSKIIEIHYSVSFIFFSKTSNKPSIPLVAIVCENILL
jgi:ABC-type transporter MlaC component